MSSRTDLLRRMEMALERMEKDGASENSCEHYTEFLSKYEAIKRGAEYEVTDVAPAIIAAHGGMIPYSNVGTHGERITPRGDLREAVKSAVNLHDSLNRKKDAR